MTMWLFGGMDLRICNSASRQWVLRLETAGLKNIAVWQKSGRFLYTVWKQ